MTQTEIMTRDLSNHSGSDDLLEPKGIIVNLQDYSVHDGYGIRTLIFLKGCPLRCPWCQNPEAISLAEEIKYQSVRCIECLKCAEVCPCGAILEDKERRIDKSRCDLCMRCVEACPSKALSRVGVVTSVDDLMRTILSYKPFYDQSQNGGVTLSGGEPTFQPKFTLALLKRCKENGIHTAMETCGYVSYDVLRSMLDYLDLVLYDLKHMKDDVHKNMKDDVHKKMTGVSNKRILENFKKLSREKVECVVRIPLIVGFNDDEENVRETSRFVASLGVKKLDLLPFNELPSGKYKTLGLDWEYKDFRRQSNETLAHLKGIVESYGLEVTIGGMW